MVVATNQPSGQFSSSGESMLGFKDRSVMVTFDWTVAGFHRSVVLITDCFFPVTFPECPSSSPVFEMIYERNPVRCKFERRLEVKTSPLNIIYNPQAMKKVTEFFYKGRVHTSGTSLYLFSLASSSRVAEVNVDVQGLATSRSWS